MPSNSRKDNQYYGKYCECAVVACLNNAPIEYREKFIFSNEEQKELFNDAKLIADYLGSHKATYLGNHTSTESGDILLDNDEVIEIKRVSSGSGTYFNTSIYYFEQFGFNFKDYMENYSLYDALEKTFGEKIKVNRKTNSPISQKDSSMIRHSAFLDIYEQDILPVEANMRECFTKDIVNYFAINTEEVYRFITDMLEKKTSINRKHSPDRLIVLNYNKQKVREINLKNFKNSISNNIRITQKGLVVGNIRVIFGWQNGTGLNNPTIRVFLEE